MRTIPAVSDLHARFPSAQNAQLTYHPPKSPNIAHASITVEHTTRQQGRGRRPSHRLDVLVTPHDINVKTLIHLPRDHDTSLMDQKNQIIKNTDDLDNALNHWMQRVVCAETWVSTSHDSNINKTPTSSSVNNDNDYDKPVDEFDITVDEHPTPSTTIHSDIIDDPFVLTTTLMEPAPKRVLNIGDAIYVTSTPDDALDIPAGTQGIVLDIPVDSLTTPLIKLTSSLFDQESDQARRHIDIQHLVFVDQPGHIMIVQETPNVAC